MLFARTFELVCSLGHHLASITCARDQRVVGRLDIAVCVTDGAPLSFSHFPARASGSNALLPVRLAATDAACGLNCVMAIPLTVSAFPALLSCGLIRYRRTVNIFFRLPIDSLWTVLMDARAAWLCHQRSRWHTAKDVGCRSCSPVVLWIACADGHGRVGGRIFTWPGIGLAVGEGLAGNAKAAACPARLGPKEQAE